MVNIYDRQTCIKTPKRQECPLKLCTGELRLQEIERIALDIDTDNHELKEQSKVQLSQLYK
jgi:hypothetical protein